MSLTTRILLAMVSAIVLGYGTHHLLASPDLNDTLRFVLDDILSAGVFTLIGKIFIASLKVLVVPLVFVSLVCGVCHLSDQSSLGRMSLRTVALYLFTTCVAISLALTAATVIGPGNGADLTTTSEFSSPESIPFLDVLANIFPSNPFKAMVEGNMLQIIVFALLVGLAIGRSGVEGERVGKHFSDWNEVIMTMVGMLMQLAPYGVFSLLFTLMVKQGLGPIEELIVYMGTVVLVLFLHGVVVYGLMLKFLTGLPVLTFMRKMWSVQMFAFSTASSSATLPVTIRNAEQRLGVGTKVASFALPLGATINMDGTAIMQGVATVFIAQAFGLDLTMGDYLMVIATATIASIGTAGVPGVGLVTLAMVLQQVGLPVEGIALIIGVDRLLDMIRTAINVTGDTMVAVVVAESESVLNADIYNDRVESAV